MLLLARRIERLQALELPNTLSRKVDITDRATLLAAVAEAEAQFGPADALINNAIRVAGGKERLVRFGPFMAFTDGNSNKWAYRVVRVSDVESCTVEEWVAHYERLSASVQAPLFAAQG